MVKSLTVNNLYTYTVHKYIKHALTLGIGLR